MAVTVKFRAQVTIDRDSSCHIQNGTCSAVNVNPDGLECIVI